MDYIHYTYFVIKGEKTYLLGKKKCFYVLNVMRLICIHTRFTWFSRARALEARTILPIVISTCIIMIIHCSIDESRNSAPDIRTHA